TSVMAALARLGVAAEGKSDAKKIQGAARVILPGVGSAAAPMARLDAPTIKKVLSGPRQPVVGISLVLPFVFHSSYVSGGVRGLGVIPGTVKRLYGRPDLPVPHMGWNRIQLQKGGALLQGLAEGSYVYFVHGYAVPLGPYTLASCAYGETFTAVAA